MKRIIAISLLGLTPTIGITAPAAASNEVEHLLKTLGSSSCEFYRNGSWHEASEAEAHLRKKYNYLTKKGMIGRAEDFIAKGGTESSMSGEPYQVKCPNETAQPSAAWLMRKLAAFREAGLKAKTPELGN